MTHRGDTCKNLKSFHTKEVINSKYKYFLKKKFMVIKLVKKLI